MKKINEELKRKIFEMRKMGMSYEKIARELNLSEPTVAFLFNESRKLKAYERSKKYFKKAYENNKERFFYYTVKSLIKKLSDEHKRDILNQLQSMLPKE